MDAIITPKTSKRVTFKEQLKRDSRDIAKPSPTTKGILLSLPFLIAGCAGLTYYDPTSYRSLTELKPVVANLYETFKNVTLDEKENTAIRLRLAQIYEYEKGKGKNNEESTGQIKEIQEMFEDHLKNRRENGSPWNQTQFNNALTNIMRAFDEAIETEALKNKNE